MKYKTITKNDSHHNDGSFFLTFHPMFKLILDFVSIIHDIVCAQSCYYWLKNNEIDVQLGWGVEVLNRRIIDDVPQFCFTKSRIQNLDNIKGRYDILINVQKDGE